MRPQDRDRIEKASRSVGQTRGPLLDKVSERSRRWEGMVGVKPRVVRGLVQKGMCVERVALGHFEQMAKPSRGQGEVVCLRQLGEVGPVERTQTECGSTSRRQR